MKRLFIILLVCYSTALFAQDFKLFNSESKKLFSTFPELSTTYSLSFDSITSAGSDSIYYNFFKIEEMNFVSYDCDFWVGPDCYKQNVPVWIGAKIEFNNQYSYNFYPDNGDTIHFDFAPNSDTNTFYIDNDQKFSLTFENSDTLTILNFSDSARFYKIHHTDLAGNIINSQLNGQPIIICKNLGLVRFFQIDDFPVVLNPITLIGQENQNLGIFNITNEMLYDFQPGDEFQYKENHFYTDGPPWENYTLYKKHTITERIETTDSLVYTIDEMKFYEDSSFIITNTINKTYYKNDVIAQLPFEKFNGDNQWFYLENYCDLSLWTYRFVAENSLEYCETDNVWGYWDTFGPPPEYETIWAFGLGMYYDKYINYLGSMQSATGYTNQMIYFKKDNIVCGDEIVGNSKFELELECYQVFPNPVNDLVVFKSLKNSNSYSIEVRNALGQEIRIEDNIHSSQYAMNVATLKPGIYFYMIKEKGSVVQQGKMIKK